MFRRAVGVTFVAVLSGLVPASSASAGSAGSWTAPVEPSAEVYPARYLTASPFGAAYTGDGPVIYRAAGASSDTVVPSGDTALISGSSLIYTSFVDRASRTTFVDLSSGVTSTIGQTFVAANLGGMALDDACCSAPTTTFKLHHSDGTVDSLTVNVGLVYGVAGSDANGFAFWYESNDFTKFTMYYYDLTAHSYRTVVSGAGNPLSVTLDAARRRLAGRQCCVSGHHAPAAW